MRLSATFLTSFFMLWKFIFLKCFSQNGSQETEQTDPYKKSLGALTCKNIFFINSTYSGHRNKFFLHLGALKCSRSFIFPGRISLFPKPAGSNKILLVFLFLNRQAKEFHGRVSLLLNGAACIEISEGKRERKSVLYMVAGRGSFLSFYLAGEKKERKLMYLYRGGKSASR